MKPAIPLNTANAITLVRCLCVPFFIGIMVQHRQATFSGAPLEELHLYRWIAIGIFAFAAISDALDGFIARQFNQRTTLGTILDPLADKLLLVTAVIMMSLLLGDGTRLIPFWFMLLVLSRDFIILIGIVIIFMFRGRVNIEPTRTSKITTTLQMLCVVCALLRMTGIPAAIMYVLYSVATLFTVISGVQYIGIGLHMLHDDHLLPPSPGEPC
jgi:CDP-diacylglycerol--glycerol-3-phosphate 3-phosphatidyltransferase/cardiolipin synthase